MLVSGFTFVRNATLLDFPIEASILSILPGVDECVVNVGLSDDDTRDRIAALHEPRIRIIDSVWDTSAGTAMLAVETQRAMAACRGSWGFYIQADEVLATDGALRLRELMERNDRVSRVEGILVNYRHFYGGFDTIAVSRKWYRREVRAVRLDASLGIHSYRDAQGFRVGAADRRVRAVDSGVTMHHYGWARPAWALASKRETDRELDPARRQKLDGRPLLPWIPGITPFAGQHPITAEAWIASRRTNDQLIDGRETKKREWRLEMLSALERATGWRPFEFRNYTITSGE